MTTPTPERLRPVRSFVLREGRITEGQRRAFEQHWPRYGLDYRTGERIDPAALFGNGRPVHLEIGFGNGETLAALASSHPEVDFLGIEVHRPGVGHLLLALAQAGADNARLIRHDAAEILDKALPDACLDGVYLFFPDPWPKTRHHKRRMVQPEFAARVARVLRPAGFLRMATDWEDYARHMLRVLEASPDFENAAGPGGFAARPPERPLTRFERRGQRLGHGVWDLLFVRR